MDKYESLYELIHDLVMRHSPSGVEQEVDEFLLARFNDLGLSVRRDLTGNVIVHIPGDGGGKVAITAHKDEIGAIVTSVAEEGRLKVRKLSGAFPWVYGEGIVDLLGDFACITGVLSFGSRHVSHLSPQQPQQDKAPVRWEDTWVETKLTAAELAEAGIRPGTRMVVGKHRKAPFRLKDHIASYTLDNKASLAILLEFAGRVGKPRPDLFLVASAKEEVGGLGALYFSQRQELDALIALEICPISAEYTIVDGPTPVLLAEDAVGQYDETLNSIIRRAASKRQVPLQIATISGFGSDGSHAMRAGHIPRAACLGFPTQNTHGYEIAHLGAIANCVQILEAICDESFN